ncbi:hypothetical protein GGI06_000667 [Coemansia sp. S85]|nr:hypothetical protein GGI06_000667 [Coemansia sp. S85]
MARTLKVTLIQTTREQRLLASIPTALDIESNIRAFVQRIRLVAPMTRSVCISLRSRSSNESQFATQPFGSLVEQLGQLGNTIEHRYSCRPLPLEPPPTGISSLTLEYSSNENRSNLVMRLARHNSATLRALVIYVGAFERIAPLVLNDDGSCVEYLHLQELRIVKQIEWTLEEEPQSLPPVYPGAIPFPNLRRLSLKSEYPFGDDTPFRGNASTLEYLYLDLGYDMIRILRERQVFTRESHPKLQHVCSMAGFISIQSIFDSDASYMTFITSIGPLARVREMDYLLFSESFHSVIPVLGQYTCLQVLEVMWSFRSIREVITLIRALPLLSDLRIGSVTLGAQIGRSYKHRLPAHMVASYAPISKRFRCWQFASCFSHDVKMLAYCVLLLALLCPGFDYAAVPARDRELFMAHMKRMVATDGFRPYKEQLRRLLFGGWKNDIPSIKNIETWG